ncbi:ANTAR domain-containing protein [Mycolicibacterium aurum]|uniref:ANTAR domain-containing protein n=1 Tax=Mycolicibacterium aurum TaxID=1791 RepID=UPI0009FA60E0
MYPLSSSDLATRKQIDVAVGILVALRRCSEDEAFREIAAAVHQTGVPLGATARSLIAHAKREPTAHSGTAARLWGDLFSGPLPQD